MSHPSEPTPKGPRTDDELRAAVAHEPCATCGAPPAKLDVFRFGTRAIVAGKCPFCTTPRSHTFCVEPLDSTSNHEAPLVSPLPVASSDATAETLVRGLLAPENPPRTVGALFDALGIPLEASVLERNATGVLVDPRKALALRRGVVQRITAHYAFDGRHEGPVATLAALRERRLIAFTVACAAKDEIRSALKARWGAPREMVSTRWINYGVFGPWAHTLPTSNLAWFEELPAWLRAPRDSAARRATVRTLIDGIRRAPDVAGLEDSLAKLPKEGGVLRLRERDRPQNESEGIEVAFVPPIPATELADRLAQSSVVGEQVGNDWHLRRLSSRDETGPTAPLTLGAWVLVPKLEGPPTGSLVGDSLVNGPFDVVTSLYIGRPPPRAPSPIARLVSALIDGTPKTVGALCDALGVTLTGDIAAMANGHITVPNLLVRYALDPIHERAPATLEALRKRPLVSWTATFRDGMGEVEIALALRFGEPRRVAGDHGYGTWTVRRGDADRAGTLSFHAVPPQEPTP